MNLRRMKRPSAAFIVAMIALFVALGGTAGAVVSGAVPLAKRALVADNAKKLGGQSPAAIVSAAAQAPGPASSAAGIFSIKTGTWSLNPGQANNFTVTCDSGQKAVSGGWADPGDWSSSYQTLPTSDGSGWMTEVWTPSDAPGSQSGTTYAICVK